VTGDAVSRQGEPFTRVAKSATTLLNPAAARVMGLWSPAMLPITSKPLISGASGDNPLVEDSRGNVMRKMRAESLAELVKWAPAEKRELHPSGKIAERTSTPVKKKKKGDADKRGYSI